MVLLIVATVASETQNPPKQINTITSFKAHISTGFAIMVDLHVNISWKCGSVLFFGEKLLYSITYTNVVLKKTLLTWQVCSTVYVYGNDLLPLSPPSHQITPQ